MTTELLVRSIYEKFGKEGLAYYLQGSGGPCIACGEKYPHKNNCEFVKFAKKHLDGCEVQHG